jgi:hypothetical protein
MRRAAEGDVLEDRITRPAPRGVEAFAPWKYKPRANDPRPGWVALEGGATAAMATVVTLGETALPPRSIVP